MSLQEATQETIYAGKAMIGINRNGAQGLTAENIAYVRQELLDWAKLDTTKAGLSPEVKKAAEKFQNALKSDPTLKNLVDRLEKLDPKSLTTDSARKDAWSRNIDAGVMALQKAVEITPDGDWGPRTDALSNMRNGAGKLVDAVAYIDTSKQKAVDQAQNDVLFNRFEQTVLNKFLEQYKSAIPALANVNPLDVTNNKRDTPGFENLVRAFQEYYMGLTGDKITGKVDTATKQEFLSFLKGEPAAKDRPKNGSPTSSTQPAAGQPAGGAQLTEPQQQLEREALAPWVALANSNNEEFTRNIQSLAAKLGSDTPITSDILKNALNLTHFPLAYQQKLLAALQDPVVGPTLKGKFQSVVTPIKSAEAAEQKLTTDLAGVLAAIEKDQKVKASLVTYLKGLTSSNPPTLDGLKAALKPESATGPQSQFAEAQARILFSALQSPTYSRAVMALAGTGTEPVVSATGGGDTPAETTAQPSAAVRNLITALQETGAKMQSLAMAVFDIDPTSSNYESKLQSALTANGLEASKASEVAKILSSTQTTNPDRNAIFERLIKLLDDDVFYGYAPPEKETDARRGYFEAIALFGNTYKDENALTAQLKQILGNEQRAAAVAHLVANPRIGQGYVETAKAELEPATTTR